MKRYRLLISHLLLATFFVLLALPAAAADKPNILVIMSDDVGITNVSAYSLGLMGYKTPNIDRIAKEGALFTDYYGEQSCTAGRASFITGQNAFRVGLTKVGMPGAKQGLSTEDPTLAELLMPLGYVSGQFGKNHLGDRNEYLPTVHGFDEYAGVLYHLNAFEEPENIDYPKDPAFFAKFGPRDVIQTWATDKDDKTVDPRFGKVGKQKIKSLGPLTTERMKTYDDETLKQSIDFMQRAVKNKKPFFVWYNSTRTHIYTHLRPKYEAMIPEKGLMGAAMTELDDEVGALLKELESLGIEDNTIVVFTADNGGMKFGWPDGQTSPFMGDKDTTWESGVRVPALVKWPGVVKPGTIFNDLFGHNDWVPTLMAAAGEPDIKAKLLKGHKAGNNKTYKVHLDGYNQTDFLSGKGPSARKEFHYITDDGDYAAVRVGKWKISFLTQQCAGQDVWDCPYMEHRYPRIADLRADPFEHSQQPGATSGWQDWSFRRIFLLVPAQVFVKEYVESYKDFPPRGTPASFSVGDALKMMERPQHN
jgi:arylsulfatase A-like enzyme